MQHDGKKKKVASPQLELDSYRNKGIGRPRPNCYGNANEYLLLCMYIKLSGWINHRYSSCGPSITWPWWQLPLLSTIQKIHGPPHPPGQSNQEDCMAEWNHDLNEHTGENQSARYTLLVVHWQCQFSFFPFFSPPLALPARGDLTTGPRAGNKIPSRKREKSEEEKEEIYEVRNSWSPKKERGRGRLRQPSNISRRCWLDLPRITHGLPLDNEEKVKQAALRLLPLGTFPLHFPFFLFCLPSSPICYFPQRSPTLIGSTFDKYYWK